MLIVSVSMLSEFEQSILKGKSTFSRLTVAEINGGLDGLLLSEEADKWESKSEMTLSQILDMYYTPVGVSVTGRGEKLSACDR